MIEINEPSYPSSEVHLGPFISVQSKKLWMRGYYCKKFVSFVTRMLSLLAFTAFSLRLEAKILKHKGPKGLVLKGSKEVGNEEYKRSCLGKRKSQEVITIKLRPN